jgi:hypothetical protein
VAGESARSPEVVREKLSHLGDGRGFLFAQLRDGGLADAALYVYWSYEFGYLGIQFYFVGHKAAPV